MDKKSTYTKKQRILAIIGLIIVAALIIGLIIAVCVHASSGVILSLLFCIMVIPCAIYGASIYVKRTVRKKDEQDD